jgi:ATP-dependent phosphoenolpyruvate carboxykinase
LNLRVENGFFLPNPLLGIIEKGAPFMMRHPSVYAELLEKKIKKHDASCWLVNTGLTCGPDGTGKRMEIKYQGPVECSSGRPSR